MAKGQKKRKAWLHVGVPGAGEVISRALVHHHHRVVELGVASVARTDDERRRAAADLAGYLPLLARRAAASNVDIAFSDTALAVATPEQAAALADALTGLKLHVVVTTGAVDTDPVLATWRVAVRKPERLHLIDTTGMGEAEVWKAFGRTAGFGTASLGLAGLRRTARPA